MTQTTEKTSPRRTFLGILLGVVGLAISGAAAWPVWRFLSPRAGDGAQEKVKIPRSEVPLSGAHFFNFHGKPAVVLQPSPGKFTALSAVCTHLGCVVKWVPESSEFLCPCHAGRYSADGKVIAGPPPEPLEVLPISLADEQILVG